MRQRRNAAPGNDEPAVHSEPTRDDRGDSEQTECIFFSPRSGPSALHLYFLLCLMQSKAQIDCILTFLDQKLRFLKTLAFWPESTKIRRKQKNFDFKILFFLNSLILFWKCKTPHNFAFSVGVGQRAEAHETDLHSGRVRARRRFYQRQSCES